MLRVRGASEGGRYPRFFAGTLGRVLSTAISDVWTRTHDAGKSHRLMLLNLDGMPLSETRRYSRRFALNSRRPLAMHSWRLGFGGVPPISKSPCGVGPRNHSDRHLRKPRSRLSCEGSGTPVFSPFAENCEFSVIPSQRNHCGSDGYRVTYAIAAFTRRVAPGPMKAERTRRTTRLPVTTHNGSAWDYFGVVDAKPWTRGDQHPPAPPNEWGFALAQSVAGSGE